MRVATGISRSWLRACTKVLPMMTPCASVSMAVLLVPASVYCRRAISSAAAASSCWFSRSALWTRLGVTGSNVTGRPGLGWWRRQRVHDWITASLTRPDGRMPSSK